MGWICRVCCKRRGLKVTGLTISKEQLKYAEKRISDAGLTDMVNFKLQDYRDERGKYDGIASIEMFEAVGENIGQPISNALKIAFILGNKPRYRL